MTTSARDAATTSTGDAPTTSAEPTPGLAAWITTVPPRPPRSRRRTVVRLLVLVAAAGVALALLVMFVAGPRQSAAPLDPADTGRSGARAVAEVLRQHGVDVSVVRSVDDLERTLDGAGSRTTWTVVMADASYLGTGAAQRLSRAVEQTRRFVLVEPDDVELQDLQLPLSVTDRGATALTAGCSSELAHPGDRLSAGWTGYAPLDGSPASSAGDAMTICFPSSQPAATATGGDSQRSGAVVVLPPRGRAPETVVVGSAQALSNGQVLEDSHAALALRSLGPSEHLLWYVPGISDLDAPDPSGERVADPSRGVPEWLTPAAWLLAAAVITFALARGRRLGRLVVEPLPVVVRASETTEARGRLYHRASDRPFAARVLRVGSRTRLADRLGLPRTTPVVSLVDATARASGLPRSDVEQLLDGPDPTTDRDLLLLSQGLADLEESVRNA